MSLTMFERRYETGLSPLLALPGGVSSMIMHWSRAA
jgi:hypothetical protein